MELLDWRYERKKRENEKSSLESCGCRSGGDMSSPIHEQKRMRILEPLTTTWTLDPGTTTFVSGANCIIVFAYSNGYVAAPSMAPAVAPATRDFHGAGAAVRLCALSSSLFWRDVSRFMS